MQCSIYLCVHTQTLPYRARARPAMPYSRNLRALDRALEKVGGGALWGGATGSLRAFLIR